MHNFKEFPELTDAQMQEEYFNSPHKQITQDFRCKCVKVIDGDTIRVNWSERNFDFPVRFINIAAPENKEAGGLESKLWLENKILNKEIEIRINKKNRVGKWGRLLGYITQNGMDIGQESIIMGQSKPWSQINDGQISDNIKLPKEFKQW